jgi:hypothetical protein
MHVSNKRSFDIFCVQILAKHSLSISGAGFSGKKKKKSSERMISIFCMKLLFNGYFQNNIPSQTFFSLLQYLRHTQE